MKNVFILLLVMISSITYAQVGVNTNTPDPSAVLDVESQTQGLLMPRMTTVQKLAIATPATGLIVFDTDLNSFQYYDGTSWVFLDDIEIRDNYKLVKSIDDLADELLAGGGTEYLLNTNHLYEINGAIIFDFPINLNGAYIEGVDSTEDRLVNNSTESLITGTTGGSIRNITLVGSIPMGTKRPIFTMTGTASDLLLINNVVMVNASKVGTINGFGTVFISISQYLGNDDGFTINNVNSFFVSNIFWTETNTGTFMEFTGSFEDLQMNSGRIVVDTGETGIDVSSNPTIQNDATLSQLSFVEDGTFVDGYTTGSYTGFNFTKDWNVNCSGIPTETDEVSSGNFYLGGTITDFYSQSITAANGLSFQIRSASDFVASDLFRFRSEDNNNDLIYEGKDGRSVQVTASLSVRVIGADDEFYAFSVAQNGSVVSETTSLIRIDDANQIQNVALNGVLFLQPDDRIEIYATRYNGGGTDTMQIYSQNLSVR